ncbi:MAG TPA: hypothetical protein VGD37_01875 [Kofleriaceae bacterium]
MIASWRGLAVAAAIAVALAAILIVDVAHTPVPPGPDARALVPGFDPARVTELIWERAGRPAIRAVRAGDRWELRTPGTVPADTGAIGDVLAALRGGRWHREGAPRPAHGTLTVVAGPVRHVIGIAEPIAGTEQGWIVDDGRGVVVDSWVARALDRDPLSLRIRRPLADAGGARAITITGSPPGASDPAVDLRIEGTPRRRVRPSALLLAPEAAGELERALREVAIVRVPDGPSAAHGLAIRVAGIGTQADITIELGGSCPGAPALIALAGTAGDGCVERAAAEAVERAVARLLQPPDAIVERRPVPFEPQHLVLADGAALDTSPPRLGDAAADPARVTELLAALAAPAAVAKLPAGPATGHIVATARDGAAVTLDLFAGHMLARHGEPLALAPPPGAFSLLTRPSRELRDPTLWLEEPTMITTLTIDDVGYQRGAVIGDWTRRPAGPGDAAGPDAVRIRIEALVAQLAAPRALGFLDGRIAVAHRVAIEVTPPVGAPTRHELELGTPRPAGCPARIGQDTVVLPAAVCAGVAALAPRRNAP